MFHRCAPTAALRTSIRSVGFGAFRATVAACASNTLKHFAWESNAKGHCVTRNGRAHVMGRSLHGRSRHVRSKFRYSGMRAGWRSCDSSPRRHDRNNGIGPRVRAGLSGSPRGTRRESVELIGLRPGLAAESSCEITLAERNDFFAEFAGVPSALRGRRPCTSPGQRRIRKMALTSHESPNQRHWQDLSSSRDVWGFDVDAGQVRRFDATGAC